MIWLELGELEFIMGVSANHFANWYLFRKLSYCLEEFWLVGSLEVFELLASVEGDEVGNGTYLESAWCISDFLSVAGCENQIWILVGFCSALERWLDAHAWWAGWAPEINDQAWTFFDQLLQMRKTSDFADFTNFSLKLYWRRLCATS